MLLKHFGADASGLEKSVAMLAVDSFVLNLLQVCQFYTGMLNVEQAFDYMHQKSLDDAGVVEDRSEDENVLTDLLAAEEPGDEEERELESLDRQLSDIADALGGKSADSGRVLDVGRLQEMLGPGQNVV